LGGGDNLKDIRKIRVLVIFLSNGLIMRAVCLHNRLPVGGGCVYVLQMFFFVFFPSVKNMRQPFSGTAERIFMELLPNDRGEM